jgi:drug/metabolite transporter (DMT)-like permease
MPRLTRVDVMLALTVLIWAFNITVTRYVLTHGFRPLAYGAIRYGAAAALAAGVAYGLEDSLAVGGTRRFLLIGLASTFLLINQSCVCPSWR